MPNRLKHILFQFFSLLHESSDIIANYRPFLCDFYRPFFQIKCEIGLILVLLVLQATYSGAANYDAVQVLLHCHPICMLSIIFKFIVNNCKSQRFYKGCLIKCDINTYSRFTAQANRSWKQIHLRVTYLVASSS